MAVRGSEKPNSLPWAAPGGGLSTHMLPPCASTICRAMAGPGRSHPSPVCAKAVATVEAVEEVRQVAGGDALPVVGDRHEEFRCIGVHGGGDGPADRRVAQRVVDEVEQHLVQPLGIGNDGRRPRDNRP